jgi:hypothetical protein
MDLTELFSSEISCPYCHANIGQIEERNSRTASAYSDWMSYFFNPNEVSTECHCRNCKQKFYIERMIQKVKFYEEYIVKRNDHTEKIEKDGYEWVQNINQD